MSMGCTWDTSWRVLVCQYRKTHTHTCTPVSHTLCTALTPPTLTHIKKQPVSHTLPAAYLVPLRLHRHHFCSVSCYETTLGACVDSPGFRATGGTRRHFYLPCFCFCNQQLFVDTDEGFVDFLFI